MQQIIATNRKTGEFVAAETVPFKEVEYAFPVTTEDNRVPVILMNVDHLATNTGSLIYRNHYSRYTPVPNLDSTFSNRSVKLLLRTDDFVT